jgi:hypothetical protein
MPHDETNSASPASRGRRERSTRYPGVPLAEAIKLVESIEQLGVDGLSAADIASALGYKNIKTNTFSAPLSAARQFGLLALTGDGYGLTPLAREILHPVNPDELPSVYRQALLKPPLYADLAERFAGKKVPEAAILGNVLYHHHSIIATAKQAAAEAFLESARYCAALGEDNVFHPHGSTAPVAHEVAPTPESRPPAPAPAAAPVVTRSAPTPRASTAEVRVDLRLWDADAGKSIRLRAPQAITPASFERFLQTFQLLVRVEEPGNGETQGDPS